MARILAYTSPARGHLFPITAILLELASRGHDVAVRTLAGEVPRLRGLGIEAQAVDPRVESVRHSDWQARGARARLATTVQTFVARARHDGPDLQDAIGAERPDAVIVDTNAWGAQAAAEAWGGPWASVVPYPIPLASPDTPPFGLGLPPARGWSGRVRDRAVRPLVLGATERAMLPAYNEARRGYGLPAFRGADDFFLTPPLLLYLTAEPFEYPRRHWPETIALVGPCDWDPPTESPPWLDDLDRPLVLVTTSSEYQADERLARTALEALRGEDVAVVVTVPSVDPASFVTPANARVERFVAHGALLDRACCAVTHGGMGATQKALARGVPVCAVPFGRDQLDVARRVEVVDAGTRVPARRLSPERLSSAVRQARACADGARRVAEAFRAAGGPSAAADHVERRMLAAV